jgi:hypothetical protein
MTYGDSLYVFGAGQHAVLNNYCALAVEDSLCDLDRPFFSQFALCWYLGQFNGIRQVASGKARDVT